MLHNKKNYKALFKNKETRVSVNCSQKKNALYCTGIDLVGFFNLIFA